MDHLFCTLGPVVAHIRRHGAQQGKVGVPALMLDAELVVGRSPDCGLRLSATYVSGKHALIRWTGQGWELRDLASTNGTYVDGARIKPGSAIALQKGHELQFGDLNERWQLTDDDPPQVSVVSAISGDRLTIDRNLLALPSPRRPLATIYRSRDGRWLLEAPDTPDTELIDGRTFTVGGVSYRFSCPGALIPTASSGDDRTELRELELRFGVTRDEEYVEVQVVLAARSIKLRPRNHDYILLLLARLRRADAEQGHPDPECGWTYQDVLEDQLDMTQSQMNIAIFRLRREFEALGIRNAAAIVERRPRIKQLRIGTGKLEISRL